VRVQGEGAAVEIAQAIREFNEYGDVDILIVGRGGGSIEDLWAFNDERVARAIYQSEIPLISAVGHEIDFTISDFVADVRAPTPSAAAELVVRNRDELFQHIRLCQERMIRAVRVLINQCRDRVRSAERSYGFRWPVDRVREYRQRLDDASKSLEGGCFLLMDQRKTDLQHFKEKLGALSPESVLKRGYSITTRKRDGRTVTRSSDIKKDERIRVRLAEGALQGVVEVIEPS
jgi:exodeoxyribonuclease VII large subunit